MSRTRDAIDDRLQRFIESQPVFFVATAPLSADGHVNLSPKGLGHVHVLAPDRVAYLDLVGSGAETIAHLRENGRIVLMFCAFEGAPNILRLHGRGRVVEPADADFDDLATRIGEAPGARSIIEVTVARVAESCGYGVPLMETVGTRDQLPKWAEKKGREGVVAYEREHNLASIDGLPALRNLEPS